MTSRFYNFYLIFHNNTRTNEKSPSTCVPLSRVYLRGPPTVLSFFHHNHNFLSPELPQNCEKRAKLKQEPAVRGNYQSDCSGCGLDSLDIYQHILYKKPQRFYFCIRYKLLFSPLERDLKPNQCCKQEGDKVWEAIGPWMVSIYQIPCIKCKGEMTNGVRLTLSSHN